MNIIGKGTQAKEILYVTKLDTKDLEKVNDDKVIEKQEEVNFLRFTSIILSCF